MTGKTITLLAIGTRGDVQPAVALGKALRDRGHTVRVLCGRGFAAWVESYGLQAAPSQVDMQEVMDSPHGRAWVANGMNMIKAMRFGNYLLDTYGWKIVTDAWAACQDADLVISSFTSDTYAAAIAEKLAIPQVSMPLQPSLVATRCGWAVMNSPFGNRNGWLNYWFGRLVLEPFPWNSYGRLTNRLRRELLSLPEQNAAQFMAQHKRIVVLHAYSRYVIPQPADWPPSYHTTGYWFLDESAGWVPPPGLDDFLQAGPPPLYIGFGSMTGADGATLSRIIVDALRMTGQRAVLHSGWANLVAADAQARRSIFAIERAPHNWLFPRVSAVIHHGGAGTTAAGLRAGRPTLIIPHMADQPYWGRRVAALGAGLPPIPRPQLTLERLVAAIRRLTEGQSAEQFRQTAAELGEKICAEDGLANAIRLID